MLIFDVFFFSSFKGSDALKSRISFLCPNLEIKKPTLYSWLKSELRNNHTNHINDNLVVLTLRIPVPPSRNMMMVKKKKNQAYHQAFEDIHDL